MNYRIPLSLIALAAMASPAHADPIAPAELKVIGTLDVPACIVTAGDDGVYDYGDLSPTDIRPGTATHVLAAISKAWKIECEGDTYLTFQASDNAAASRAVATADTFGLGNVNGDGKIGNFGLTMRNPRVDGTVSRVFSTNNTTITPAATVPVRQDGYKMGWAHPSAASQQIGRTFDVDLEVIATLAGSTAMKGPITDDVPLAGSVTLNFAYGL